MSRNVDDAASCNVAGLTGQCTFSDAERDLLALPPRLGGLGIINPASYSSFQFSSSVSITAPLHGGTNFAAIYYLFC